MSFPANVLPSNIPSSAPSTSAPNPSLRHGTLHCAFGMVHIVIGVAAFMAEAVQMTGSNLQDTGYKLHGSGAGAFLGIFYVFAGGFAVIAVSRHSRGLLIAVMVFNIINTLLSAVIAPIYIISMDTPNVVIPAVALVVSGIIVEFLMSITQASFCCKSLCSCCQGRRRQEGYQIHQYDMTDTNSVT